MKAGHLMSKLSKILETSIINTLRFNLHYFGYRGFYFPVLIARNYSLTGLRGSVKIVKSRPGCVRLGYSSVGIFDRRYDRGLWQCSGEVVFDGSAVFAQGSKISVGPRGCLSVGEGFRNMAKGEFVCHELMRLGTGSLVSWDTLFMDTDFHHIDGKLSTAPVSLGDNVWVGCRCMLLKGATVPDGSVLAAGTTVTKALYPDKSLFGGVNKLMRVGVEWNE